MTFSVKHSLVLAATLAATGLAAQPALAQSERGGVSITIKKGPSYLNTRTVARPRPIQYYGMTPGYQPTYVQTNSISFARSPLPSAFDPPGN